MSRTRIGVYHGILLAVVGFDDGIILTQGLHREKLYLYTWCIASKEPPLLEYGPAVDFSDVFARLITCTQLDDSYP